MSWRTNTIAFPVRLVKAPNVPGVNYVYDAEDDEICVLFGQTEATGETLVTVINAHAAAEIARREALASITASESGTLQAAE